MESRGAKCEAAGRLLLHVTACDANSSARSSFETGGDNMKAALPSKKFKLAYDYDGGRARAAAAAGCFSRSACLWAKRLSAMAGGCSGSRA